MISREELLKQLQAMPSSLNDACRTMELAADFINGGVQRAPSYIADRLTDVIQMLEAPDAYTRLYIAAVCRATLSTVTSTPSQAIEKTEGGA